jgi:hypothetical protein
MSSCGMCSGEPCDIRENTPKQTKRHGDALSPYLFITCAEVLSIMITNNKCIKGITICGKEYKIFQYAND